MGFFRRGPVEVARWSIVQDSLTTPETKSAVTVYEQVSSYSRDQAGII
jgi:hypothetical protein